MTTQEFSDWLSTIDDVEIIKTEEDKICFFCAEEDLVVKFTKVAEDSKNILSIQTHENKICFCLHNNDLDLFVKKWLGENKKGVPDLSWVTTKQMALELKKRDNLTFVLLWMEDSGYDNISLEASGNPTTLCGMLIRGLNMAVKHADKNINFIEPKDEQ